MAQLALKCKHLPLESYISYPSVTSETSLTHVLVKSVCKALTIQNQKDIFSTIPHVCPHKNLYTYVQSRFICNSQNLEMNQMPFKGQAVKLDTT